jgi:sulfite exporter TauE/SafE
VNATFTAFIDQEKSKTMNVTKNLGMLLLSAYLIVVGLMGAFGLSLGQLGILVPLLAIAAGVFLLIGK